MPKPVAVSTFIGKPVEIPLEVVGRVAEPLTFLIRRAPQAGTLGEIRRTGKTRAVVIYSPQAGAGPMVDEFLFAAKSVDSPVSAPARVVVDIREQPVDLRFVPEVDFGETWIGDPVDREIEFRNVGGGVAYVELSPEAPWQVVGPTVVAVRGGTAARMALRFAGSEERDYAARVAVASGKGFTVRARSRAPLTVEPATLLVTGEKRRDPHALNVTNLTDKPRRISVSWPDFLRGAPEAEVPPGGTHRFDFVLNDGLPATFSAGANATIRGGTFEMVVPVRIDPAPAEVEVAPKELRLKVPELPGAAPRADMILTNRGGSPARLSFESSIDTVVEPAAVTLAAGGVERIQIRLTRLPSAEVSGTVSIRQGGVVLHSVSFRFDAVLSPPGIIRPSEPSQPRATPAVKRPPIPSGFTVRVEGSTSSEVTLGWVDSETPMGFEVQRREIVGDGKGAAREVWHAWPDDALTRSQGGVVLRRIPANTEWTVRIAPKDGKGGIGRPSLPVQISTKPARTFSVPAWFWILSAVAAGVAIWKLRCWYLTRLRADEDRRIDAIGRA